MKTLATIATLTIALFAWSFGSLAYIASTPSSPVVISAQDDCNDGETWNEETKKCEKAADAGN